MQDVVKPRDVTVAAVTKQGFRVVGLRVTKLTCRH